MAGEFAFYHIAIVGLNYPAFRQLIALFIFAL
jgi:hypothetical protein